MPRLLPGKRPSKLGVVDGKLQPINRKKPNSVSSQTDSEKHQVAPLAKVSIDAIRQAIATDSAVTIVEAADNYLYAEYQSKLIGFVDDVEFLQDGDVTHVRSASRVGYSDWGVNRKRIEALRAKLAG